ncbi:hypothetical protein BDW02DRAFT_596858 [Decorospora gaudefroyi]|uniref:GPI anchored protein n=1 Tax=Decorospora gaudefroyi TaxID=184978 RepID=A0A6A5KJ57_9PLEO|nr:hypothetical protein BDW02DRAFT_596858 [Decorospora gaudefroyi]
MVMLTSIVAGFALFNVALSSTAFSSVDHAPAPSVVTSIQLVTSVVTVTGTTSCTGMSMPGSISSMSTSAPSGPSMSTTTVVGTKNETKTVVTSITSAHSVTVPHQSANLTTGTAPGRTGSLTLVFPSTISKNGTSTIPTGTGIGTGTGTGTGAASATPTYTGPPISAAVGVKMGTVALFAGVVAAVLGA